MPGNYPDQPSPASAVRSSTMGERSPMLRPEDGVEEVPISNTTAAAAAAAIGDNANPPSATAAAPKEPSMSGTNNNYQHSYERPPHLQQQTENGTSGKKRIQFNMSSRIQVIPNNRKGQLNTAFLGTVPGVLKIAEIVLAFIAFVLAICADRRSTTASWTEHIAFETSCIVAVLLLAYVCFPHLTLRDEPTREGLIVVELLFYGVNTLFYFIAIWLMVHLSATWGTDGRGAAIMSAVVCVALTVLFALETALKAKAWMGENEPRGRVLQTGNRAGSPVVDPQTQQPYAV